MQAAASATHQKLIQVPICRGLSETEAARLCEIAEDTTAKKSEVIFKEGEPGDALYILLEGTVEILKKDRAGVDQQLARLSDGTVFGEMSLINGHAARSASAVAATDVRLLRIPSSRFSQLLVESDLGALKVVHNLAQVMSRRLLLMDEKLVDVLDTSKRKEELANFQQILTKWAF